MKTMNKQLGFGQKVLVLAIAAAFAPVAFAEDDLSAYTQPSSSVSVGVGALSGDSKERSIFGQYNGLRQDDAVGILDVDYVRRDEATGTWSTLNASNLGLDNREISVGLEKQGDWKVGVAYDEITHREIRTINTANTGVGSTTPGVVLLPVASFGKGADVDLKLQRKGTTLIGEKWLSPSLLFEFSFKNEDKDGARFNGKGYDCAAYVCGPNPALTGTASTNYQAANLKNAILMQADPVNTNTKQLDMKLVFSSEKFNGQVGYYGSMFSNRDGSVNMTALGSLYGGDGTSVRPLYPAFSNSTYSLQNVLELPFALAPDNQAHQLFTAGTYAFTKTTKLNFKAAFTHATQNDSFAGMGLSGAPAGVSSLNGEVNTTLLQLGITSKPIQKLTLNANVRYEDKDDKTPKYRYNVENTNNPWFNADTSAKKLTAKAEASYQLPENFRATLGVDYKEHERGVVSSVNDDRVAGISVLRAKTEDINYRAELSRVMSDTLSGSIAYITGTRRGSDWTSLNTNVSAYCGNVSCYGQALPASAILGASATSIFPMSMTDINRDKWKMTANWTPMDNLSLQFMIEDGSDRNATQADPAVGGKGYRKNGNVLYSIDAAYTLSDNWQLTAFYSMGKQTLNVNHSSGYLLALDNESEMLGLGVVGKLTPRLSIGANAMFIDDNTHYGIAAAPNATTANVQQAGVALPDVVYRQTTLNLFGKYALDKKSDLRLDVIHQQATLNEWSWSNNGVPFVFADGTTVTMNPKQEVTYLGLMFISKF